MSESPEDRSIAVSIDHISKTYPVPFLRLKKLLRRKFKPPVEALTDVSFEIREGEIFGLIGPNGAGKTTLTKIIATLVQPTSGRVSVRSHDTVQQDEQVRTIVGLATANKQRLSVARAMLHNPPILLLDEPTRSLDPLAAARTRTMIRSLARNH